MDKAQIAEILEEIGFLLELKGENPFKTRAYENGARIIKGLTKDINQVVSSGEIRNIKGIGTALADKITELVQTGRLQYYEKLKLEFPDSLLEMAKVPGLGPKKIRKLYDEQNIKTIADLEQACKNDKIAGLEGFGHKTQEKILEGIEFIKKHSSRHLFHHAFKVANQLLADVKKCPGVIRAEVTGSLRRCKETVKDIDIVASAEAENRTGIMDFFTSYPGLKTINAKGETKSSIITAEGMQADLRIVSDDEFPYTLHHFTGSKEHNTAMRGLAKKLGIKMSEWGLFKENGERIDCKDEKEIFAFFKMDYIPPELREDLGEIEAAHKKTMPVLIEKSDIKGILHTHTTYSDGANTLREMAEACKNMGMEYLGISDHSQIVVYANGLSVDRLKNQAEEIRDLNEELEDFHIFHGTECDIMVDGSLDFPDEVLANLDFVVISVHQKLSMTQKEATDRIIKAMQNPYVTILGHPTGRVLLEREGYPLDYDAIFAAAVENNVVIEINASPYRFDLDWRYIRQAKERGVKLSINPDAHNIAGLADTFWGVGIARKGWLTNKDVLNTMTRQGIADFFMRKRQRN